MEEVVSQLGAELFNPDSGLAPFMGVSSVPKLISDAISTLLLIGAMVVFICLVWGGWQWMTGGDNEGAIQQARERLTHCLVGFAVLATSYAAALLVQYFLGIEIIFQGDLGLGDDTIVDPPPPPPPIGEEYPDCDPETDECPSCNYCGAGGKCLPMLDGSECNDTCVQGGTCTGGECTGGTNPCPGGDIPDDGNCGYCSVPDYEKDQCVYDCREGCDYSCPGEHDICDQATGLCIDPSSSCADGAYCYLGDGDCPEPAFENAANPLCSDAGGVCCNSCVPDPSNTPVVIINSAVLNPAPDEVRGKSCEEICQEQTPELCCVNANMTGTAGGRGEYGLASDDSSPCSIVNTNGCGFRPFSGINWTCYNPIDTSEEHPAPWTKCVCQ